MKDTTLAAADAASNRDPRTAAFGMFVGSSFGLSSVQVFEWFESLPELTEHLLNVLPDIYELEDEDLVAFQSQVAPLAKRLKAEGFNDALLNDLNETIKADMRIEWWGTFDELAANQTEFSRNMISRFRNEDGDEDVDTDAVAAEELDDFVMFLKTCDV